MSIETEFYNTIKLNKPNISESYIKIYSNRINNFYSQNTKYKTINKKRFLNSNKFLELVNDKLRKGR